MLLHELLKRQQEGQLSDAKFAKRLGIARSTWQLTRTGKRPLRRRVAIGAMRAYSDLTPDVVRFLLGENATVLADAANSVA